MKIDVVVHNIRSLFNIGACFRNADAFGVDHLYLAGYTAAPPRPEIAKTALGADKTVAWSQEQDAQGLIERLKQEGKTVIAFESDPSYPDIKDVDLPDNLVALFGNEPDGLPSELLETADIRVQIPMMGEKTSLNIAVANGVALYALRHK